MSGSTAGAVHRHGWHVHSHPHSRPHGHFVLPRSRPLVDPRPPDHDHRGGRAHDAGHGHSHGLVDRSIVRSREGVKVVSISLAVLGIAAGAQVAIFLLSGSVALFADLIHKARLSSPALLADGNHARVDGFVSLGVVASAIVVSLGLQIGDPIIGLAITLVILRVTWQSWRTVSTSDSGEMIDPHHH